jgi:hypothetical protein
MRVLVGPRADLGLDAIAAAIVGRLAGPGGAVVSLRETGIRDLSRRMSAAEVALLREALAGGDATVGYVCRGAATGIASATGDEAAGTADRAAGLVAVTDHANLTWRSPLTGPNDDRIGPRFPTVAGVYAPAAVLDRLGASEGMIAMPRVVAGVVAGVLDDGCLSGYEREVSRAQGYAAASSELVPVVIVAAHLGLRVAAVVMIAGSSEKETRGG